MRNKYNKLISTLNNKSITKQNETVSAYFIDLNTKFEHHIDQINA